MIENDDEGILDQIAIVLGEPSDWSGAADLLETIADLVAESGRPHPGTYYPDVDYANLLAAKRVWSNASPAQQKALVEVARRHGGHL